MDIVVYGLPGQGSRKFSSPIERSGIRQAYIALSGLAAMDNGGTIGVWPLDADRLVEITAKQDADLGWFSKVCDEIEYLLDSWTGSD